MDVPRSTAAFHLDRLADEGLLDVVYERRTGRSGPGAGRPSKLYRRSDREVSVSLPDRRYGLAGQLLAAALEEAEGTGSPPRDVLERQAREAGQEIGADAAVAAQRMPPKVPPAGRSSNAPCSRHWSRGATSHASTARTSSWPTARSTPWPSGTPTSCAA